MTSQILSLLSPRLQRLQADLQKIGNEALCEFWDEIKQQGTPIIEPGAPGDSLVTFLWRDEGSARSVAVIQDWGADGIREHQLMRLPDSDVWYLTRTMRSNTRTTYQLSPSSSADPNESAPYQLDPLNPKTFTAYLSETGADILFSLLELPEAPALPWRQTGSVKAGTVQLNTPFADQRRLWVYTPALHPTTPLPVLVVFDGRLYKELLKLPEMLDYLIDRRQLPPVIALMVDNANRSELLCKPEFADSMTNEILPWLRATYPVTHDPHQTIVMGSSFGGLAAAFLAFQSPKTWGTVLSQSGWFRWHPEEETEPHWLTRQLVASPKLPIRFWLQVGNLEVAQMLDGGPSQLAANQHLRDVLQAKGYEVGYHEYSGGHDASSLEFPLAQALTEILN
jgi:enterochelin esterase-like enzyme